MTKEEFALYYYPQSMKEAMDIIAWLRHERNIFPLPSQGLEELAKKIHAYIMLGAGHTDAEWTSASTSFRDGLIDILSLTTSPIDVEEATKMLVEIMRKHYPAILPFEEASETSRNKSIAGLRELFLALHIPVREEKP